MGLFDKFKEGIKKLVVSGGNDGKVMGGDFLGYGVTLVNKENFLSGKTYVGITPLKLDHVVFGLLGKENFIFGKEDIIDVSLLESHAHWSSGNGVKEGNRYKINFKDGKSSIINIVANSVGQFDAIFM